MSLFNAKVVAVLRFDQGGCHGREERKEGTQGTATDIREQRMRLGGMLDEVRRMPKLSITPQFNIPGYKIAIPPTINFRHRFSASTKIVCQTTLSTNSTNRTTYLFIPIYTSLSTRYR